MEYMSHWIEIRGLIASQLHNHDIIVSLFFTLNSIYLFYYIVLVMGAEFKEERREEAIV